MALQQQNVAIKLTGLDTKADSKFSVPGVLELIENAYQRKLGEYQKRDGFTSLTRSISPSGTLAAGKKVACLDDNLLMDDGTDLYQYSQEMVKWLKVGRNSRALVTLQPLASGAEDQVSGSTAVAGNYQVIVWEEVVFGAGSGNVRYSVRDLNTGAFIVSNESVGGTTTASPQVVAIGTGFVILYTSGANLVGHAIAAATPTTLGGAVNLKTNVHGTTKFFAVAGLSATRAIIAYRNATPAIECCTISAVPAVDLSGTSASATNGDQGLGWLHWDASDGNMYLATGSSANGVLTWTLDTAALGFTGPDTVDAAATATGNITGYYNVTEGKNVHYEIRSGTVYNSYVRRGRPATATDLVRGMGIGTQCFKVGARYYLGLTYPSDVQGTYFVMDVTESAALGISRRVVGKMLLGIGAGLTHRQNGLPAVALLSSTRVQSVITRKTKIATQGGLVNIITGVDVFQMDFDSSLLGRWVRAGASLYMPGGVTLMFDGKQVVEAGFHLFQEAPALVDAGAGNLSAGTYQICSVIVWHDAAGNVHRSAPSPAASITLGASRSIGCTIPTLRLTDKNNDLTGSPADNDCIVEVYSTTANGTIFYLANGQSAPLANNTAADTVAFTQNSSDANLVLAEELYTTGDVVDNIGPPASRALGVVNNRLFVLSSEDDTIWVSKEMNKDNTAAEFSDELKVRMDGQDGPALAVAGMDGRVVIFKRNNPYIMTGDGPDDRGVGMYATPRKVAASVGPIDSRSVQPTPEGIMFKSPKGIYLFDRGESTTYVGAAVEEHNSLTVTGSAMIDDLSQARFTTSDGKTLVYDWAIKNERGVGQWYVFTNQAAVDCTLWKRGFVFLASDGTVKQEVANQANDDGTAIITKYKLAWLNLAQLGGLQRIYELQIFGEFIGNHTLKVTWAHDFSTSATQVHQGTPGAPYLPRSKPSKQMSTSVQITIEDAFPGGATRGFKLSGLSLLVGIDKGAGNTSEQYLA
jgi:hypothetical protein